MTVLEDLKEYSSLISTVLSLATLGFLVHIVNLIRNAAKDKIEALEAKNSAILEKNEAKQQLLEEQNQFLKVKNENLKDEIARTDKWYLRDIEKLKSEISKNEEQLKSSFNKENIDLDALISASSKGISKNVKESLDIIVSEMLARVEEITKLSESATPEQYLELGKGLMAVGKWKEAAEQLDKYTQIYPSDWEVQFSKGVAYANSRESPESNLSSLRAYNEAIAFFCKDTKTFDANLKARLFTYRGAILKRLGCIDEAKANLIIAKEMATSNYEVRDVLYNLACIYALERKRKELFETINLLKTHSGYEQEIAAIQWHRKDYFSEFANDKNFLELIELTQ